MKKVLATNSLVLAVAPSSRGLGFGVLEGERTLVHWGVKAIDGDKNKGSIAKVEELIARYHPGMIVLEDYSAKDSRRCPWIRGLGKKIVETAKNRQITVALLSREKVRKVFFMDSQGTKDSLAEMLAARFSEELGPRLPPKRRTWMSKDYRMDIFDAVALAVAFRLTKPRKVSYR